MEVETGRVAARPASFASSAVGHFPWKVSAPIGDGIQVVTGLPVWKVSAPMGEGVQVVTGLMLMFRVPCIAPVFFRMPDLGPCSRQVFR